MSDLHNPLFDDEKEFLERKKREYERALRGDVAEIKEKTVQVGKFALAGAGVAGSVWLITRLLGHKKDRPRRFDNESGPSAAPPKSKKNKKGPKDPNAPKSAAASAAVFQEALGFDGEEVDRWPRRGPAGPEPAPFAQDGVHDYEHGPATHEPASTMDEHGADVPSPATHEPDPFEPQPAAPRAPAPPKPKEQPQSRQEAPHARKSILGAGAAETLGTLAKAAWQSETARGLISQAVAAGLAALAGHAAVKSAVEDAQAPKNPDLAARADAAAAGAGAAGPFSSAQPSSSDAPRQHPA